MPRTSKTTEDISFEKALGELEDIVEQLEAGNLTLDKSLDLFKRGIDLARACKQKLDSAELKVSQIVKDKEGLFREEPFEDAEPKAPPTPE